MGIQGRGGMLSAPEILVFLKSVESFVVQLEAELRVYWDEKITLIFYFGQCPELQNKAQNSKLL